MLSTLCLTVVALAATVARADWTTYHADGSLSGVDQSSGSAVPFAPAWTVPNLGGAVWAEPLVYRGLVYVATESNDIYAFNESNGALVWHVNAGAPVSSSDPPNCPAGISPLRSASPARPSSILAAAFSTRSPT